MSWVWWSLATALAWASVNIIDQLLLVRYVKSVTLAAKVLGFFSLVIVFGLLLAGPQGLSAISGSATMWAVVAGVLEIFYIYFYLHAIEKEEVSFIVTIFSFSPIVVALLAWLVWGETFTLIALAGIGVTVLGTIAMIWSRYGRIFWRRNSALRQIFFSTVIFALYTLALDQAIGVGEWLPVLFWSRVGVVAGALVITLLSGSWDEFRQFANRAPYVFFISEILYGVSVLFSIQALKSGSASFVVSVENIQPLFVFAISYGLFKLFPKLIPERVYFVRPVAAFISILVIIAGITLIQF